MTKEELYINHLKEKLQSYVADGYTIEANWEMDVREDPTQHFDSKTIFIILTKFPSVNNGSSTIQSIIISALCETKAVNETFRILELYQKDAYNKKYFLNEFMINESFYSPSITQNFLDINVSRGTEITMQGTVVFSENVSDIKELYFFNEKINFTEVEESWTTQPISQTAINVNEEEDTTKSAESINQSAIYRLQVKMINGVNTICNVLRDLMHDKLSMNITIPVKIVYTDNNVEFTKEMIVISITRLGILNGSPLVTFSLIQKMKI